MQTFFHIHYWFNKKYTLGDSDKWKRWCKMNDNSRGKRFIVADKICIYCCELFRLFSFSVCFFIYHTSFINLLFICFVSTFNWYDLNWVRGASETIRLPWKFKWKIWLNTGKGWEYFNSRVTSFFASKNHVQVISTFSLLFYAFRKSKNSFDVESKINAKNERKTFSF